MRNSSNTKDIESEEDYNKSEIGGNKDDTGGFSSQSNEKKIVSARPNTIEKNPPKPQALPRLMLKDCRQISPV